jgi:hypothetical protein
MSVSLVFDTLLEASARAIVIAGLIAVVLVIFRVKAASTRHAAWTAIMVTMLALPVASGWVPTIPVPVSLAKLARTVSVPERPALADAQVPLTRALNQEDQQRLKAQPPIQRSNAISRVGLGTGVATLEPARDWRGLAVLVWLVVAAMLLLRELAGWWRVSRLARACVLTPVGDGSYQSDRVLTPVVAGVLRPRVLVPASWPRWGQSVRQMVLAHERAHIDRRDPLIASLARVNRAVFWFHPLSWWMERHLSRLAERACDAAVVRDLGDSRRYAALLVEMAHRLRHQGRRVAWQGIGIVSARRFEDRLNHIMRGPAHEPSRRLKIILAAVCGLLVIAGIACGTTAAAPLVEDPELAKEIADRAAEMTRYESAVNMTLDDVAELERVVAKNPEDLVTTQKLLWFYRQRGQTLMGWERTLAARRPHLLRMIAAHPESELAHWPFSQNADPEGYRKARILWMDRLARDVTSDILANGARFFERSEKPIAEQLLLRAQTADPKGPTPRVVKGLYRMPWSRRLGELYAMAIVGSDGLSVWDRVTSPNIEQTTSAFAKHARQVLDDSSDVQMLVAAAWYLTRTAADAKVNFDQAALGLSYAKKALALDPTSAGASQLLSMAAHDEDWQDQLRRFGRPAHTLDTTAFKGLPESARMQYAIDFLYAGQTTARSDSPDAAFESLNDRAEALQLMVNHSEVSAVPPGLQASIHLAFGTSALHRGNRREAVRRLALAASATPGAPSIANHRLFDYSTGSKLVYDLLDAGERESVANFYDAVARSLTGPDRTRYEDAAKAIRAGRMPADYQRFKAQAK